MNNKGFTLTELLSVIVIFVIVCSVVVGGCGGFIYKSSSRTEVTGKVTQCSSMMPSFAQGSAPTYSFGVEIMSNGEYFNFSSEDRQFAAIKAGDSASVVFYKYPPWEFWKEGTNYGGRLKKKFAQAQQ